MEYFFILGMKKYNIAPRVIKYKKMLSTFIAIINVVTQVPRFAPIIIPKQSLGLIYFDDNKVIAIAVVPEEDCIAAEAISPNKKLLNLVFTDFVITVLSLVINKLFKENFI